MVSSRSPQRRVSKRFLGGTTLNDWRTQLFIENPLDRYLLNSTEQLKAIADSTRAQEKMLDALAVAQPIIDDLVEFSSAPIDSLDAQVIRAYDEILAGIEEDHAAEMMFDRLAKGGQLQMFREAQLLSEYRRGGARQTLPHLPRGAGVGGK